MTDERRRSSDRELGELSANVAALTREVGRDRADTERRHTENRDDREKDSEKLDQLLGLKPQVEANTRWIETEGRTTAALVKDGIAQAKGAGSAAKAIYALLGVVTGGAAYKAVVAIAAVFR